MGEYAEMMLDGTCCAGCGEFLFNEDALGIPEYCPSCQGDSPNEIEGLEKPRRAPKRLRRANNNIVQIEGNIGALNKVAKQDATFIDLGKLKKKQRRLNDLCRRVEKAQGKS